MKHNNVIPNAHFHKHWARLVKTWFDQPGRARRRASVRRAKALELAPRPISSLRPVVRAPTVRYNTKQRLGRGFTVGELKEAKIGRQTAHVLGISVDHRRKNVSLATFHSNVDRLKAYKSKIVLFPRTHTHHVTKKKDSKRAAAFAEKTKRQKADAKAAAAPGAHVESNIIAPVAGVLDATRSQRARAITEDETKRLSAYFRLRRARSEARLVGVREKQAKERETKKLARAKKDQKAT